MKIGKKTLMVMLLVSLCMMGVSAGEIPKYPDTHIYGAIYYPDDPYRIVEGANVTVYCFHENESYIRNDVSSDWSDYYVSFTEDECINGDLVVVEVSYGSGYGYNSSYVNQITDTLDDVLYRIDVAVINVPLVPEFGIIIGSLTIVSAVALFFIIQRK